jgi:hypothetical protein
VLSQQRSKLNGFFYTYFQMTGTTRPHTNDELATMDKSTIEICGSFALTHSNARSCMDSLDIWVLTILTTLEEDVIKRLTVATERMFAETASGIHGIVVERDSDNNVLDDELPPVLPHQRVKIDLRLFEVLLSEHKPLI